MLVVDASVAVKLVVEEPDSEAAASLLSDVRPLIAPDWVLAEVANALRHKVRRSMLSAPDALEAVVSLPQFFQTLHPSDRYVEAALTLAVELNHAFYDCVYLALAIDVDGMLVTADRKFVEKIEAAKSNHPVFALGAQI